MTQDLIWLGLTPLAIFCAGSVRKRTRISKKNSANLNLNPEDINMFIFTTNVFFAANIGTGQNIHYPIPLLLESHLLAKSWAKINFCAKMHEDHTWSYIWFIIVEYIHVLVLNQQTLKQSGHLFEITDCRIKKLNATHLQPEILLCNVRGMSL